MSKLSVIPILDSQQYINAHTDFTQRHTCDGGNDAAKDKIKTPIKMTEIKTMEETRLTLLDLSEETVEVLLRNNIVN